MTYSCTWSIVKISFMIYAFYLKQFFKFTYFNYILSLLLPDPFLLLLIHTKLRCFSKQNPKPNAAIKLRKQNTKKEAEGTKQTNKHTKL